MFVFYFMKNFTWELIPSTVIFFPKLKKDELHKHERKKGGGGGKDSPPDSAFKIC